MTSELPASFHASMMRRLDEHERNALIAAGAPVVVDARELFERASPDGKLVTMPHPWEPEYE